MTVTLTSCEGHMDVSELECVRIDSNKVTIEAPVNQTRSRHLIYKNNNIIEILNHYITTIIIVWFRISLIIIIEPPKI